MFLIDDHILLAMVREDAPYGDQTTRSLACGKDRGHVLFRARDPMVVCAVEEAARMLELLGCAVDVACASGDRREPGDLILAAKGRADGLLTGWKVAQTLLEWASGVATAADRLVTAARAVNAEVVVACTRKAIPGTRAMSLKAVTSGGASIHRTGLSDTILLFPEHRAFDDGIGLQAQIRTLRAACPERSVVVEVTSHDEALAAAQYGADVVQLEKFTPEGVAAVVAALGPDSRARIAAAGGVNATNAAAYASSGAPVLVTSAPYYAKPCDVAVSVAAVEKCSKR
ncbi:MAG: pyrophosphorylase [Rhodospirillaceae bacterium BRH_c57]|nr:MAG: pyrophosphorylase [Rhodospirillaceae bacterium BRH_c57]